MKYIRFAINYIVYTVTYGVDSVDFNTGVDSDQDIKLHRNVDLYNISFLSTKCGNGKQK